MFKFSNFIKCITIPAGKEFCRFVINEKKPGESDKWETYSKLLERKTMNRLKDRKKRIT